jgi:hypothetical protein
MDKFMLVRVLLIVVAIAILATLISKYSSRQKAHQSEKFFDEMQKMMPAISSADASSKSVQPSGSGNGDFKAVEFSGQMANDCFPKDRLTASDLLPKDAANSAWAQVNPAGQGDVKDQNFLQSGYHVGLNTTQGATRNGNMQIRSEIPNPQNNVSPWLNSTLAPDLLRKPLEIGEDC